MSEGDGYTLSERTDDIVVWEETVAVAIEREGSIPQNASLAWGELHKTLPEESAVKPLRYFGYYRLAPTPTICACASITAPAPSSFRNNNLKVLHVPSKKFARFVLKGQYKHLPDACSKVFSIVKKEMGERYAGEAAWHIENYVSDPKTTSPNDIITEILIPLK